MSFPKRKLSTTEEQFANFGSIMI